MSERNIYDPILNINYISMPNGVYLDGHRADGQYFRDNDNYLKFYCIQSECKIILIWESEIPINIPLNQGIPERIIEDPEIGEENISINANEMFKNCNTIKYIDFTFYKTNKIYSMTSMFEKCTSLERIDGLSLKDVNDFSSSFKDCVSLTSIGINNIEITNIATDINMEYMFYNCISLKTLNLGYNIKNVNNMNSMFFNCSALYELNINNFNTDKVLYMNSMFEGCHGLKSLNLSSFI